MKIRILKNDPLCTCKYRNDRLEIDNKCFCDVFRTKFELDMVTSHHSREGCCLSSYKNTGDKYFLTINTYANGKSVDEVGIVGSISTDEDKTIVNIEKVLENRNFEPNGNHVYLITSHFPSVNFFNSDFDRSILTSDGVVKLDDGQVIGVRDGNIEELDANELLEIISRHKTEKSPSFGSLRLDPVAKRPSRPRKGTVIYNSNTDSVEVYNGKDWKKL